MKKNVIVLVPILVLALTGFKWVKLTEGGEKVRVLKEKEIATCKLLGKTTVSLKSKVGPFKRKKKKVVTELKVLGRNSAADMGGDTIVGKQISVDEGKQAFDVYKCVDPSS